MFTLEIAGLAVAVTDADEAQARDIFESEDFLDDIRGFTVDGKPVWDGEAAFVIRAASEEEVEAFAEIDDIEFDDEDDETDDDGFDDEDGASVMFLVDVDQFREEG